MFNSIMDGTVSSLSVSSALFCSLASLGLGLLIAFLYSKISSTYSKNFIVTLAMLPLLVQAVIMMVNGNLGTSVAVLGAFSLVRFRSVPGSSKEIISIFFAMAVGLATGMGYLSFAAAMTVFAGVSMVLISAFLTKSEKKSRKELKVTIPENLDYSGVFEDIFNEFTSFAQLDTVKTVNLGSMFELQYSIQLKDEQTEKQMIDSIRCRNGNLTVICRRAKQNGDEVAL